MAKGSGSRARQSSRDTGAGRGRSGSEELIRVDGELPARENRYYKKISERYRAAGFLLILVFVLFLGVMLIKYGEYITYDNFVYLMRDFDSMRDSGGAYNIKYPAVEDGKFAPFKGGVAVHSGGLFTLYDSTGVELVSRNESMSSPTMSAGKEYLLLYDIGGRTYSLYNSLTRVMSHQAEGNIICASVSDGGAFSVTYESKEARYVTDVYGKALTRTMRIYKDKYVVSSAVSDDGEHVAVVSAFESEYGYGFELSFYASGSADPVGTVTEDMAFPLYLYGMKDGNFVLICDSSIRFYSSSGEELSVFSEFGRSISYFDVSRSCAVIVSSPDKPGGESRIWSFGNDGSMVYSGTVGIKVIGAAASYDISNGCAGYVTDGSDVLMLDANSSSAESAGLDKNSEIIRIIDTERGPLACTSEDALRLFGG